MANKQILWIFPALTQLIFSLLLPLFSAFSLENIGYICLFTTLPSFLLALVCVHYQFHQRNILQIGFWSASITFLNTLILFSLLLAQAPKDKVISVWEQTFALFSSAFMFSLPAIVYTILVLRCFLPKYN